MFGLTSLRKHLDPGAHSPGPPHRYPRMRRDDVLADGVGPAGRLPPAAPERLLVFRPDHIGDVILTTPMLRALRLGFPRTHITILIGSWARDILSGNPDVDEIIVCDLPGLTRGAPVRWRDVLATLWKLRRRRFDAIINPRTSAVTALLSLLCGGGNRWGYDLPKSGWAWSDSIPFDPTCHVVDAMLDLAGAMGCDVPQDAALRLFPDERARHRADVILGTIRSPFVVLHQGAGHPTKIWEPERWAAVADWVAEQGYTPVLSGSAKERDAVQGIRSRMKHEAVNLAGHCDLLTFAEVIGRSRFMVSVDSASMHMAVAMQTPVVALFGPTDSRRWGPYANGCPNVVVEKKGECPFCKRHQGCPERECMKKIPADQVIAAAAQVIEALANDSSAAPAEALPASDPVPYAA